MASGLDNGDSGWAMMDDSHGWAGGGATFGETRAEVFRTLGGGAGIAGGPAPR